MDAQAISDRRRLRRKVTFWRLLAVVAIVGAVIFAGLKGAGKGILANREKHIARINITGFIDGEERALKNIKKISESETAEAVIIAINSPGGTTTGSEALYHALRQLAAKKPTISIVTGLAASGGYITAIGTDRIFSRETALVGSIGVLIQYPDVSKLLETMGVKVEEIKSAPLKAAPNPFDRTTPEARAALQYVVNDTYEWFKDLVKLRRGLNADEMTTIAEGRIYSGRQALKLKLIDELGGEQEAINWLVKEKNISKDLPVRDWKQRSEFENLPWNGAMLKAAAISAELAGFQTLADTLKSLGGISGENYGMQSVWKP